MLGNHVGALLLHSGNLGALGSASPYLEKAGLIACFKVWVFFWDFCLRFFLVGWFGFFYLWFFFVWVFFICFGLWLVLGFFFLSSSVLFKEVKT